MSLPPATADIDPETVAPRGSIVVIDDVADLVESVVMLLELSGFAAYGATDGPTGIARAAEVDAEVVVLDFLLPEMNGAEIGKALRAHPTLAGARILMVSASPESQVRNSFTGYDAFLSKPVFAEDLVAAIDAQLAARAQSQENRTT